ncbi:MAG: DNA-binding protein [Oligoflexus sp.]|nr:DNA-binding protein [Oligoflexus sp.]
MKTADRTNIFQICDALNDKGQKPTLDRVRQMLGGGSFTTIQPILREWKDKRSEELVSGPAAVPDDIRGMLDGLATQIWAKASTKAGEDLKALREGMQARLDEAEQEKADAAAEVLRLETETVAQKEKIEASAEEMQSLRTALQAANIDIQVQSKQIVEAEGLAKRHEKLLLEVGELRGRLAVAMEKKKS